MNTKQLDLDTKSKKEDIDTEKMFPFKNEFASIEKLEEDIIRKICPLCGAMKDLEFAKTNSGYIQRICLECAVKYVKWWEDRE